MLVGQRAHIATMAEALGAKVKRNAPVDVVALWRAESSRAALRFIDRLGT